MRSDSRPGMRTVWFECNFRASLSWAPSPWAPSPWAPSPWALWAPWALTFFLRPLMSVPSPY